MQGECVLITGAAGGIGSAAARELAPHYRLLLQGRRAAALEPLAAELREQGSEVELLELDLSSPSAFAGCAALKAAAPTHLVHSAGVAPLNSVAEAAPQDWENTLAVNVAAPAELTRLLLPSVRRGQGSVIFINSGQGLRASAGWGAYAASKHALKALADALRQEEAPSGVRVSSIYPGRTATKMQQAVRAWENAPYDAAAFIQPETVAQAIKFVLMAPRDASIDDLTVRPAPAQRSGVL